MKALSLDVELTWSGTGLQGVGQIQTDDVAPDLSGPESMGGRGVGTNPEGRFVCAVSSCYTATLFAVPRRDQLPVASLAVTARTTVTGFLAATRFARLVVIPKVIGGDTARQAEYTLLARDRCFIGRTLAPAVAYVHVRGDGARAPDLGQPLPGPQREARGGDPVRCGWCNDARGARTGGHLRRRLCDRPRPSLPGRRRIHDHDRVRGDHRGGHELAHRRRRDDRARARPTGRRSTCSSTTRRTSTSSACAGDLGHQEPLGVAS